jgi:hypothetical protein
MLMSWWVRGAYLKTLSLVRFEIAWIPCWRTGPTPFARNRAEVFPSARFLRV